MRNTYQEAKNTCNTVLGVLDCDKSQTKHLTSMSLLDIGKITIQISQLMHTKLAEIPATLYFSWSFN